MLQPINTRPFGAAAAAMLLSVASPLEAAPQQQHRGHCTNDTRTRAIVQISGLKNGLGVVRVQIYDEQGFLKKGQWLGRVEARGSGSGAVNLCIAAPGPGTYAVAVRHDGNDNGRSDWNDGGGFSRDPKLSLLNLRPSFSRVGFRMGEGVTRVRITMNYRRGLGIGPID